MATFDTSWHAHSGKGMTWRIKSKWVLKWGMDTGFFDQFKTEEFTHEWGCDRKLTWYADDEGRISRLELDKVELSTTPSKN